MPTTSASLVRVGCLLIGMLASAGCDIILGIEPPRARAAAGGSDGEGGEAGAEPGGKAGAEPGGRAGSEPGGAAGEAGTASGGMSGGDAGGSHGGSATTGGFGGAPTVAPGDLVLEVSDVPAACTGEGVTVELTANGGTAPYTWTLLEVESGFELRGHGNTATLTGTAQAAGAQTLHVTVTDASDETEELPVEITTHPTPVVEPLTLPSVCPNEIYRAELVASGGDEASYEWTTDLPEDTGLTVAAEALEGKLTREWDGTRSIDFTVSVNDGNCSASVPVTLPLEAPTAHACPSLDVEYADGNQPSAPCLNYEYEARFFVERGAPGFSWQATSLPPGLFFDRSAQSVSGIARGEGDLTVQVTDGELRTIERTYRLVPRTECWFAYVTHDNGSSRGRLFDPVLRNHRAFSAEDGAESVFDFKFSPDGQFLAYRLGPSSAAAQLVVVQLDTWHEHRLDAQAVSYYAWSDDASALAYAAVNEDGGYLGGIARTDTIGPATSPGPHQVEFRAIAPISTPVNFELTWVGNEQIAFMTPDRDDLVLTRATRGAAGFVAVDIYDDDFYSPGTVQLRSHGVGLSVIPQAGQILSFGEDGSQPIAHSNVVLSPSGRYAARVQVGPDNTNALAVFRAPVDASRVASDAPHLWVPNCDVLLTWATARERFACAPPKGQPANEILVFELDASSHALKVPLKARGEFEYPRGAHIQRRRLFSRSGRRLALSAGETLIIASFATDSSSQAMLDETESLKLQPALASTDNQFADLYFSPDESMLLQRRGTRLSLFDADDLLAAGEHIITEDIVPSALVCGENFQGLNGWCGAQRDQVPFVWSPDSKWIAYQTATGTLKLLDVSRRALNTFLSMSLDGACGTGCSVEEQFHFQPPRNLTQH